MDILIAAYVFAFILIVIGAITKQKEEEANRMIAEKNKKKND